MRHGTHDDPVRPKGSRTKKPRIPRVKRSAVVYRNSSDERLIWNRR